MSNNEIILPETSNKIKSILSWVILITAPIFFIYDIEFLMPEIIKPSTINFVLVLYGLLGTTFGWSFRITWWLCR